MSSSLKSHITQVMQNYFDSTDTRSRSNSTSLEAQLLNVAAVELEDLELRITRELSQSFQTMPTNVDNRGVYFYGKVPDTVSLASDQSNLTSVVGKVGDITRTLSVYNDTLPIPSRIEFDSTNRVPFSDPLVFTVVGSGDSLSQIYTVQHLTVGDFPIPNCLTVWLDQIGLNLVSVSLTIVGELTPRPAWEAERRKTTEVITLNDEGVGFTRNRWATIDKVVIRGLPVGARLRGWSMPFALPATVDVTRPFTTPEDRDVLFARYWQISNSENLLKEMYRAEGFTGLETVNSYSLTDTLTDICIEPNTNGLYTVSQRFLYYADRREVLPNLDQTGITAEPLFGLQVIPDIIKSGSTRYVTILAVPYAKAAQIYQYRYTINNVNSILPNGSLGPINAGWRRGAPESISFPLSISGDYVFRLEMQDNNGVTTIDVVPVRNPQFTPLAAIDISNQIDKIQGLAFDSYGRLWIWNGLFAIPIIIHYDGYILDVDSRNIFVTDVYDSLQVL